MIDNKNEAFWALLDSLIEVGEVVIDRPKGSCHPRYPQVVYELDYGYLKGMRSMDGEGMDVWRGSQADGKLNAVICTVDVLKADSEIKLLIGCTEEEIQQVYCFHNASPYMKGLLIRRFP